MEVRRDSFVLWEDESKNHRSDLQRWEMAEHLQYGYGAYANGQGRPVLIRPSIDSLDWY